MNKKQSNNNEQIQNFGTKGFKLFDVDYIRQNPVRAGIVSDATYYLYSSASDYFSGKKGLLDVDLIDPIGLVLPTGYYRFLASETLG